MFDHISNNEKRVENTTHSVVFLTNFRSGFGNGSNTTLLNGNIKKGEN